MKIEYAFARRRRAPVLVAFALALSQSAALDKAVFAQNSGPFRQLAARQLPPVRMDSFVRQAGAMAELIYGDEGVGGTEKFPDGGGGRLPPIDGFSQENRIDSGIFGIRDEGLTTGHGSLMPSAWGADEYLGDEWAYTGAHHFEVFEDADYRNFENRQLSGAGAIQSSTFLDDFIGY